MNTAEFKDSPLGPIPQDWEVKRLGEIAPLQRGFDLPTKDLQDGPFPVVYSNGICNYHVEAMCDAPGLVTGRSGTIGHFTFIESGRYWPHNTALWVTSFKGNDPLYIKYLYETLHFENFATGSGVPTLNRNAIHEFEVALPSKIDEQQRIAEALGEVDKLIESLDAQIEKKRLIAKGVAHDLLGMRNGKNEPIRRLPGFKGGWERKTLGPMGIWLKGQPLSKGDISVQGKNVCIHYGELFTKYGPVISCPSSHTNCAASVLSKRGDILFPSSDVTPEGLGRCSAILDDDVVLGGDIIILRPTITISPEFLSFIVNQNRRSIIAKVTGITVRHITSKALSTIEIFLPPTIAEQQAIAEVLAAADSEIAGLEAKKRKYEQIKSGMMHDLLTGKVRMKGE